MESMERMTNVDEYESIKTSNSKGSESHCMKANQNRETEREKKYVQAKRYIRVASSLHECIMHFVSTLHGFDV